MWLGDPHLYAIEPAEGQIVWSVDLADPCSLGSKAASARLTAGGWSEPALGPDGTIYVSTDDPYLRAIDPSGRIKWMTQLGDAGAFTLTVDRRGLVYAASEDGHVYLVSPDGVVTAQFALTGLPVFPVVAAEDLLVVTDSKDYSLLVTDKRNTIWAISSDCMENQP